MPTLKRKTHCLRKILRQGHTHKSRCAQWNFSLGKAFFSYFFWLWRVLIAGIRRCFFHTWRCLYKHHCDCFSCVTGRKSVRTVETGGLRSFPKSNFFETFTHAWKVILTMSSLKFKTSSFPCQHDQFACEHAFLRSYHVHTSTFFLKHCEHVIKHRHMHDLSPR
jgi:hypothetical protein